MQRGWATYGGRTGPEAGRSAAAGRSAPPTDGGRGRGRGRGYGPSTPAAPTAPAAATPAIPIAVVKEDTLKKRNVTFTHHSLNSKLGAEGKEQVANGYTGSKTSSEYILTNHFPVELNKDVYIYKVEITSMSTGAATTKGLRMRLLSQHEEKHKQFAFEGTPPVILYDRAQYLFTPKKIEAEHLDFVEEYKEQQYKIQITELYAIKTDAKQEINEYVRIYVQLSFIEAQKTLQRVAIGRKFYDAACTDFEVPQQHMKLMPCNTYTLHPSHTGPEVRADVTFRLKQTKSLAELYDSRNITAFDGCWIIAEQVVAGFNRQLAYKIDHLDKTMTASTRVTIRGKEMTVSEYYMQKYQRRLERTDLPLAVVKKEERKSGTGEVTEMILYLPLEVCSLTGLTDVIRRDFFLMKAIKEKASPGPAERAALCMKAIRPSEAFTSTLRTVGISIVGSMILKKCSYVGGVKLIWGDREESVDPVTCRWQVRQQKMLKPATVKPEQACMVATYPRYQEAWKTLNDNIHRVAGNNGLVRDFADDEVTRSPEELVQWCKEKNRTAVLLLIERASEREWTKYKKYCTKQGITTQVVTSRVAGKMSAVTKLLVQAHHKMGGISWSVNGLPDKNYFTGFSTVHVCGIATNNTRSGVVIGMCVNVDQQFQKWNHQQRTVKAEEVSQAIADMYKSMSSKTDQRTLTLFLRNGTSEAKVAYHAKKEIDSLKVVCAALNTSMHFLTLVRSTGLRMFSYSTKDGKTTIGHARPGIAVELHPSINSMKKDFDIVNHSVTQGTADPVNFTVHYSPDKLDMEKVQRLIHRLCYLYFNFDGAISVPYPIQMAQRLCRYPEVEIDASLAHLPFAA